MSTTAEANSTVSWFARADRTLNSPPDALEVAVEVSGTRATEAAAARELFTESTHTTLVFADGAVVRLSAIVAVGQLLFVRHERTHREIVTRVLKQRRSSASSSYVELEFTEPAPDFWAEDLVLAAAAAAGEDARGSSANAQPVGGALPSSPNAGVPDPVVHDAVAEHPATKESETIDLSLSDGAADSYELLNDSGALLGATETVAAGPELQNNDSAGGQTAYEEPPEASLTMPDDTEVQRLRDELDTVRAQMSAVLENTQAVASREEAETEEDSASEIAAPEIAKVSEDLAQMFAGLESAPAANAPIPVEEKKTAFAPPAPTTSAVTPEEFAKELEKLNRARKLGISVEELEEEKAEAGVSGHESVMAADTAEAVSEEAGDEANVTEIHSKKRDAGASLSGAAARGNGNASRIALIAALLTVVLIGGVAYWKGWIGGGVATAGASAAGAPRAGNGVLRPVSNKAGADGENAAAANEAAEANAKAARDHDAAVLSGADADGQKAGRASGAAGQGKYRQAAQRGNGAALTDEEGGDGYEPPKLVKAVNAVPPPEAVQNFVTGDVKFNAIVDEGGKVESAEVISGPEPLRAAALEALKKYQYKPAVKNGQAVAGHVVVVVKFWYEP